MAEKYFPIKKLLIYDACWCILGVGCCWFFVVFCFVLFLFCFGVCLGGFFCFVCFFLLYFLFSLEGVFICIVEFIYLYLFVRLGGGGELGGGRGGGLFGGAFVSFLAQKVHSLVMNYKWTLSCIQFITSSCGTIFSPQDQLLAYNNFEITYVQHRQNNV